MTIAGAEKDGPSARLLAHQASQSLFQARARKVGPKCLSLSTAASQVPPPNPSRHRKKSWHSTAFAKCFSRGVDASVVESDKMWNFKFPEQLAL
eukprot:3483151-Amphidinium_carterae.1